MLRYRRESGVEYRNRIDLFLSFNSIDIVPNSDARSIPPFIGIVYLVLSLLVPLVGARWPSEWRRPSLLEGLDPPPPTVCAFRLAWQGGVFHRSGVRFIGRTKWRFAWSNRVTFSRIKRSGFRRIEFVAFSRSNWPFFR